MGGGPLSRLRYGDVVRLYAVAGCLEVRLAPIVFEGRAPAAPPIAGSGTGRELFGFMRVGANDAEQGASAMLAGARSEEHTSELQSLMRISYAVFCLKKKNK